MSRKHFCAVAAILAAEPDREAAERIARELAAIFKADNGRFDRARFFDACGVSS